MQSYKAEVAAYELDRMLDMLTRWQGQAPYVTHGGR